MLPKNLESWQNLKDNLKENGLSFETIPIVIQYNKRDLEDILSVEAMQEALGFSSYPSVEAVASAGRGITETFKLVSKLTFVDLLRRLQGRGPEEAAAPSTRPTLILVSPPRAAPEPAPQTAVREPEPAGELALAEPRTEPAAEFCESGPGLSQESREAEERLASAYWMSAASLVQWRYRYGESLPSNPPPEFAIDPQTARESNLQDTPANRLRYWSKFRRAWSSPDAWQRSQEWDTSWFLSALVWVRDTTGKLVVEAFGF